MMKMAAQVIFYLYLDVFFSVWLANRCLKIRTFVLIKVVLTYLLKFLEQTILQGKNKTEQCWAVSAEQCVCSLIRRAVDRLFLSVKHTHTLF